ncbi:hypothetical protein [Zoogloea sp.]|uniref:hypothetical protein n=1 Tax=Zoogloea sp. TaxID=49181 RepID=UPI0035B2EDB2
MLEGVYADPVTGNRLVPIQCDAQGRLVVSGAGGGGGGSSDTTEATQLLVKAAVEAMNADLGAPADGAAAGDTSAVGIIALLKRSLQRWTTLLDRLPGSLGTKTAAASLPVVLASDQAAVATVPQLVSGGHVSAQTAVSGTGYTAFGAQACKQLTILNGTGVDIGVTVGGAGVEVPVLAGTYYTFFGLTNANQLSVRRVDASTTQVTVPARWEA